VVHKSQKNIPIEGLQIDDLTSYDAVWSISSETSTNSSGEHSFPTFEIYATWLYRLYSIIASPIIRKIKRNKDEVR
jgi:hypothetical protein